MKIKIKENIVGGDAFLVEEASGTNFLRYKKAWHVLETGKHSPVLNILPEARI